MAELWFVLIVVLWAGFFALEGFDFGTGMLTPFLADDEHDRSVALEAIGPFWGANQVWLLTAGGAMFAAFPGWYASMFSGFYLPLFLILVGLILRGICIEYRHRCDTVAGERLCTWGVALGSFLPALLFGVAFANVVRGLEIDAAHNVTTGFWSLLNPYALLGGLASTVLFAFHGAMFLGVRTTGVVRDRAASFGRVLGPVSVVVGGGFLLVTQFVRFDTIGLVVSVLTAIVLLGGLFAHYTSREGFAVAASGLTVALVPVALFAATWPDVMPARNDTAMSLTLHNVSSTHTTLLVMTVVTVVFLPVVLAYTVWAYRVFRGRVGDGLHNNPKLPRARVTANEAYRPQNGTT